jgi:hypothetical protein
MTYSYSKTIYGSYPGGYVVSQAFKANSLLVSYSSIGGAGVSWTNSSLCVFDNGGSSSGATGQYGVISSSGDGVVLGDGGTVKNFTGSSIYGHYAGVDIERPSGSTVTGTVINSGSIASGSAGFGVNLGDGGLVSNSGVIKGGSDNGARAVSIRGAAGTVINVGSILSGGGGGDGYGVYLMDGGRVTNGQKNAGGAITGETGVELDGGGTVVNYGAIAANAYSGVNLGDGGTVLNRARGSIDGAVGYDGVKSGGAGTVVNDGVIAVNFDGYAIYLGDGGAVTNGAANPAALLEGGGGVLVTGAAGKISNLGTIESGGQGGWGVQLLSTGSTLTNGATSNAADLVEGYNGVLVGAGARVTNFGVIIGAGGGGHQLGAVVLQTASSDLILEAGSSIQGEVSGPGVVDVVSGVAAISGGLDASGKVGGAGTLSLTGGTSSFNAGTSLEATRIAVSGASTTVDFAATLAYGKTWFQTGGALIIASGDHVEFAGTGDLFSEMAVSGGTLEFTAGTDILDDIDLAAKAVSVSGSTVTLSGDVSLNTTLSAASPNLIVAASGVSLLGSGVLKFSNLASNRIRGASATATLTNAVLIEGAGQIGAGELILANQSSGIIRATGSVALTLDTGAKAITNAGVIESDAAGGLLIKGAVTNTEILAAISGTLTVDGAVTGKGVVHISAGTADFASSFAENVAFATGAQGVLELAKSQGYAGSISGFSKTGANALDLGDIAFNSGKTKASYSGTTSSGVLTVTDGTHTAKIKLSGDYTASTFKVSSDGHGGTKVVDPTLPEAATHAFVAAMAAFAPTSAGVTTGTVGTEPRAMPTLVSPGS